LLHTKSRLVAKQGGFFVLLLHVILKQVYDNDKKNNARVVASVDQSS